MHLIAHIEEHAIGKVDDVPGLFHVATMFLWMMPFPLVPTGGVIVVEKGVLDCNDKVFLKTPLRLTSLFFAYFRIGIIALGFFLFVGGFAASNDEEQFMREKRVTIPLAQRASIKWALGFFVTFPAFYLTYAVTKASHARARTLAVEIGLNPEIVDRHFGDIRAEKEKARAKKAVKAATKSAESSSVGDRGFRLED